MINPLSVPNYPLEITLQFSSPTLQNRWEPKLPIRRVKKWVQSSLEGPAEFTLLFVGNAQSRKLNQTYRNQDHATNVLTFSLDLPAALIAVLLQEEIEVINESICTLESKDHFSYRRDGVTGRQAGIISL